MSYDFIVRGKAVVVELVQTGKSNYDVKVNGVPEAELERTGIRSNRWVCKSRKTGNRYGGDTRDKAVSAFVYSTSE
jgi:hypothetical protein